jgi:hypothetical protein
MKYTTKIPKGVFAISILSYVFATLCVIYIIAGFVSGPQIPFVQHGEILPMIILIVLFVGMGKGLYLGRNWARIVWIIVGILALPSRLREAITDTSVIAVLNLLIDVCTVAYLLFNKTAKAFFVEKKEPTPAQAIQ